MDFTFQSQKPAISSFVSANGPSITVRLRPENRTRLPLELAWSPSAARRIPALASSSLNLPISASSCWLGILPASESLVALTITMTFIATPPWNEGTCFNNINPLTPPGHQGAQPRVAQDKPAPEQCAENDRKQDFEQAILMMHMGVNRSTEVARQQDSAENGSLGDQVKDSTGKQDDSEGNNHVLVISKLARGFHDKVRLD